MNDRDEIEFIYAFVKKSNFGKFGVCRQLRNLWTAYCLHQNLNVDTAWYDTMLFSIWVKIPIDGQETAYWLNFAQFDMFMCRDLV